MRIKSLQIRARVAVEGFIKGIHRSPYHGFSVEFSEYREYSPGRRSALPRLAAVRALRPLLREAVRGRDEPALLSGRRHQPVDGLSIRALQQERLRPHRGGHDRLFPGHAARCGRRCCCSRIGSPSTCRRGTGPGHLRRLMAALDREPAGRATNLVEPLEADRRDRAQARADHPDLGPAGPDRVAANAAGLPAVARATMSSCCGSSTRPKSNFTFTTPAMFHDVESGRELYIDPAAARAELSAPVRCCTPPRSSGRASTWGSNTNRSRPTGRSSWCCSTS